MQTEISIYFLFVLLLTRTTNGGTVMTESPRPHIVVIVADDLGWNDVSFHGAPQIPTPNIDALAYDGVLFDNHYVMPLCTPSRSALLSGYHPIHTGMQNNVIFAAQPYGLPLNLTLLPQHLKGIGYATHAVGKWHLGHFMKNYTPTFRGFDSHYGYWLGHECYFDHTANEGTAYGLDFRDNMDVVWNEGGHYATDLFTDKAEKIIQTHNSSEPLFLYLAHLAVHAGNGYSPLETLPSYAARFPHIEDIKRRLFAGMAAGLDDSVGKVVRALGEARMLHNSVILFTSDNGGPSDGLDSNAASNWPLRGAKSTLWEGGVRGSTFLWSPLLDKKPDRTVQQLAHIMDWMPTLYSIAGGNVSVLGPVDGLNLWPGLQGAAPWPRDEILLNIDPIWKMAALRKGKYKILSGIAPYQKDSWYGPSGRDEESEHIFPELPGMANASIVAQTLRKIGRPFQGLPISWYLKNNVTCGPRPSNTSTKACYSPTTQPCLFDLQKDPCETEDISKEQPQIFASMMTLLETYNATSVPPRNKPNDPRSDPKYYNFVWTNWMDNPKDQSHSPSSR